jgi:hypothetical protein
MRRGAARRGAARRGAALTGVLLILSAPPVRAITELCADGFVSTNLTDYGGYLSGNDIYMRYAAAEYLGSASNTYRDNYHVIGWVTDFDPLTLRRKLRVAPVMDYPPPAACRIRDQTTLQDITDVNWVHHGGHIPSGQVSRSPYPSHGYLVWSDKGTATDPPHVAVGRFWVENSALQMERVYLERYFYPTHVVQYYPAGITPSMASNRPVPMNQDYTSDISSLFMRLICQLAMGNTLWSDYWAGRCDFGHRLLLVYSGDPRYLEPPKVGPEDPFCDWNDPNQDCHGWLGYTIRYKLFRPGDNAVLHEGILADVRDSPSFDPVTDHAVYPEVAWNEASRHWVVIWEEQSKDPDAIPPGSYNRWKARTVDEQGHLGPTAYIGECNSQFTPTSTDPGDDSGATGVGEDGGETGGEDDDRPPIGRLQRGFCYPINLANDYYSLDGIAFAGDRNSRHQTFLSGYLVNRIFSPDDHPYEWMDSERYPHIGPTLASNSLGNDQHYDGSPHLMNTGIIGLPVFDTQFWPYKGASYIKATSLLDQGYGCSNVFYLLARDPDEVHDEAGHPNQQYYRVDDAASWQHDCDRRISWAISSSVIGFVMLWAEYVPSQARFEMRFGSYTWLP